MSALSEVTTLIGQRAADLEKAREVFTSETRSFVNGILAAVRRARSEPWAQARVRIDLPREIEMEGKSAVSLESPFARCQLRFRKETTYRHIGDVRFGIEFEEAASGFVWQITLVPNARYPRMDDLVWQHLKTAPETTSIPGAIHQTKANIVRFVQRPVDKDLDGESAFADVKQVLDLLLGADRPLAEAVGIDQEDLL